MTFLAFNFESYLNGSTLASGLIFESSTDVEYKYIRGIEIDQDLTNSHFQIQTPRL